MAELSNREKYEKVLELCGKYKKCSTCPLTNKCKDVTSDGMTDTECGAKLYDLNIDIFEPKPTPHRITIRDIIDLLDYDRTGIRTVRIVDSDTKQSDTLQTDSYLMQYIEDMAVDAIDTVGGVITMYVNYGGPQE